MAVHGVIHSLARFSRSLVNTRSRPRNTQNTQRKQSRHRLPRENLPFLRVFRGTDVFWIQFLKKHWSSWLASIIFRIHARRLFERWLVEHPPASQCRLALPEALFLIQVERSVIPKACFHLTILLLLQAVYLQADDSLRFKSLVERVAENEKRNRLLEMSYVFEVTRQKISLGKNAEPLESE